MISDFYLKEIAVKISINWITRQQDSRQYILNIGYINWTSALVSFFDFIFIFL